MKSVTVDDVMAWEPCAPYTRERVTELFAGRDTVTALDILAMDILHGDRVEAVLMGGFIDSHALGLLACDFAEHGLHLFETEYPNDDRPRRLTEIMRQWGAGLISYDEVGASTANALKAMSRIAPYLEVKKTAAGNAIQAIVRASPSSGLLAFPFNRARGAALCATRACNIGGDGMERRWQVGRIREVLNGEE